MWYVWQRKIRGLIWPIYLPRFCRNQGGKNCLIGSCTEFETVRCEFLPEGFSHGREYILDIYMNIYLLGIHLKRSNGYRRNSFEGTEWIPKCEWTRIVVADTIAWYDNIESLLSRTEVTHAIWKDYMRYLRRPTTQCSRFSFIINKLTILFQKATLWDKSLIYRCLRRTSVFTRRNSRCELSIVLEICRSFAIYLKKKVDRQNQSARRKKIKRSATTIVDFCSTWDDKRGFLLETHIRSTTTPSCDVACFFLRENGTKITKVTI